MGAKLSPSGGGSKFHVEANSEINVTPFVDVMLVLLIIFMVAAPLASVNVEVKLPPATAKPQPSPPKPVYISLQSDGSLFIGDFPTTVETIGTDLKQYVTGKDSTNERIYIRCDRKTRYADFMKVMNALQDAQFYSVALIGEDANA